MESSPVHYGDTIIIQYSLSGYFINGSLFWFYGMAVVFIGM